jgi:hypothetical protein
MDPVATETWISIQLRRGFSFIAPPDWTAEEDDTAFTLFPTAEAGLLDLIVR